MELKKVWMSPGVGRPSRYGLRTLGGILGIAVLAAVLTGGGAVLALTLELPAEAFSLALVCGVTALALVLAVLLGRRNIKEATVFFLTQDDRLFAVDARTLTYHGHTPLDHAIGIMKTQALLTRLAEQPFLPVGAEEICRVTGLQENRGCWAIRCRVRCPNGRTALRTRFLVRGVPEEDLLLWELERRKHWEDALEPRQDRKVPAIICTILALAVLGTVCVLSHPALGRLPQSLYFPCLAAAFAAAVVLVSLVVLRRRGT